MTNYYMGLDKSYWKDGNKIIPASLEEKKGIFYYEVNMLRYCTQRFFEFKDREASNEKNLIIEGLALHSRVLIDFFYPEHTRIKKHNNDDISAEQFIAKWDEIKPEITQTLFDAREKTHKQLAHLTTWRLKIEKDQRKDWNNSVCSDLEKVINIFESYLETQSHMMK